jgi:glycosyltransferase involved in cell wall biosynthesis
LPEVIQDSGGGFVYRTDDELLDAMNRIRSSPALRAELGESGYARFVSDWSREAHLKLYFDYLNRNALKQYGRIPWSEAA